ncbi:hypothetical protein [Dactylosporangium sp. CA-233914]|uniref:hypothetical protein n=1 Tax=Dactylosporangium sp. CA-233914 TaxID=3239934 RepID=UPI003D8F79CE
MQVLVEPAERSGAVMVQAQRLLQGGDQALPFRGVGKRHGLDQGEASSDLPAAGAGEQALALDINAGVDERGGNAFVIWSQYRHVRDVVDGG